MRSNFIKEKLTNGEACRGVWLGLPSPFSARLLARLPVDWLLIDAEHAPVEAPTLALRWRPSQKATARHPLCAWPRPAWRL